MEMYKIRTERNQIITEITGRKGETLLDALIRNGIYISAPCGGKGICGKCRVQMTSHPAPVTDKDRQTFSDEALKAGWRLACLAVIDGECSVKIFAGDETDFEVVAACERERAESEEREDRFYEIGIDIGTTTIAIDLVGKESGKVYRTYTAINRQRMYGADVISRIQASNDGKKELLKHTIQTDLAEGIRQLIREGGITPGQISQIVIAGNTTMEHLFMGYSCETLGAYPFEPVNIQTISGTFGELFDALSEKEEALAGVKVTLLPGISVFVGADIVAGMLYCGMDRAQKPCLLIDLGTNGEMALGMKGRFMVTSTAAGPAFEGGNISCGMGSVQGAICNVQIDGRRIQLHTIGKKSPVGLCGTGVIETVYELLKEKLVDETGMMEEAYFETGYELAKTPEGKPICFTQKDVREIQLAKSAVRAGVETLLLRYGISCEEIDRVYLAGGFGYKINLKKAVGIGLLPETLRDKIAAVGNSSLGGAVTCLKQEDGPERMGRIVDASEEVQLSLDPDFNRLYMEHMFFEQ